jgi:cytochrome c-type biogenesis protein CcmH
MVIWLAFAALTASVLAYVLRPLWQPAAKVAPDEAAAAVYRDQLTELDADVARGLISSTEYDVARREIARRLLTAADQSAVSGAPQSSAPRGVATMVALGAPVAAVLLYLVVGSPSLPGQPRGGTQSTSPATNSVAELVAKVETRLRAAPDDGAGWDVIAPIYLRLNRFRDAADAYLRANRLLGETSKRLAGFAEATVLANNGIVTEAAREAYAKVLALEPQRPEPRFWLALALEQDGKLVEAAAEFRAIRPLRTDDGWTAGIDAQIAGIERRLGDPPKDSAAALQSSSPEEQRRAIDQMVTGLAERLAKNGRDLEGWTRLVRSYTVLGRRDDATAALARARLSLADDPAALKELTALAKSLGIGS